MVQRSVRITKKTSNQCFVNSDRRVIFDKKTEQYKRKDFVGKERKEEEEKYVVKINKK